MKQATPSARKRTRAAAARAVRAAMQAEGARALAARLGATPWSVRRWASGTSEEGFPAYPAAVRILAALGAGSAA